MFFPVAGRGSLVANGRAAIGISQLLGTSPEGLEKRSPLPVPHCPSYQTTSCMLLLRGGDHFLGGVFHGFCNGKVQARLPEDFASLLHVGTFQPQNDG